MPRYKILSNDRTCRSAELVATDAGPVLNRFQQLGVKDADVLSDDVYAFSLRLASGGVWSVYQRNYARLMDDQTVG